MNFLVVIWLIILIVFSIAGQSAKKRNQKSDLPPKGNHAGSNRPSGQQTRRASTYRPDQSHSDDAHPGRTRPDHTRPYAAKGGQSGTKTWFNEAEVNAADITFRDLRPGTDELEVLIRHNSRYEKTLEARLVSREDL